MFIGFLVALLVFPNFCFAQVIEYSDAFEYEAIQPELDNEIEDLLRQKAPAKPPPKPPAKPPQKPAPKTTPKPPATTTTFQRDLRSTFFQSLESYEVQSMPVSEAKYPWIAKVVHSRSKDYPYVCTAACIEQKIFITAARCLFSLKVSITSVLYEKKRFTVKVFVLPSNPTKQWFDDIGIILVNDNNLYTGKWPTVKYANIKRTDNQYQWFYNLNYHKEVQHKVIGYATKKFVHKLRLPETEYKLSELNVVIDIRMCEAILTRQIVKGFFVPCYHSCNVVEFSKHAPACQKYHGTEGGVVLNFKTNVLLGVATWGISTNLYELPVGFAIPNSDNFFRDLACARKIKEDKFSNTNRGYFQTLCIH